MHTHAVRNWGHFDQVVQTSRDLYASLDDKMLSHFCFSATDLIETLSVLRTEFETRLNAHMKVFQKILKGRTAQQLVRRYFKFVPDLVGSADEMLARLPDGITREQVLGLLMAHFDLRLRDISAFNCKNVAVLAGKTEEVVSAIFKQLALEPGALANAEPEFLFLNNPIWERPIIAVGDEYLVPLPQAAFSHIHRIMERLASEARLNDVLQDRRAEYLEQQLETVFRQALPSADIRRNLTWNKDDQQFENDLVAIVDRVVVIAEAKSHRLTASGLRGARDRVKRHVRDLVLSPSIQSKRLEDLILAARDGDTDALSVLSEVGIEANQADRVIRLSVSLYDLSVLSSSEEELKDIGWVPPEHSLAPSILITDLFCVAGILENPLLFLHYLYERAYVQKSYSLIGDELDFLGLYLHSAFNLSAQLRDEASFVVTGMSTDVDRYYEGVSAGLKLKKPRMNLCPLFRDIVRRLADKQPIGWTILGFHLLASADPAEQKAIERSLMKLRRFVQKNFRDPSHTSSMAIKPPEQRKATVMFYLFPPELRGAHRAIMAQLASETVEAHQLSECVVFGRCTENWKQAFESALIFRSE